MIGSLKVLHKLCSAQRTGARAAPPERSCKKGRPPLFRFSHQAAGCEDNELSNKDQQEDTKNTLFSIMSVLPRNAG
jgi:hypothetical protein